MARTLADMTPEERQACVGMWANISSRDELFIIDSVDSETALIFTPKDSPDAGLMDFDFITPRFDLMRAWNPDGTPVEMAEDVEYRIVDPDTNGGKYEMRRWVRGVTEWRLCE